MDGNTPGKFQANAGSPTRRHFVACTVYFETSMRAASLLVVPAVALTVAACASSPSSPGDEAAPERVERSSSAIINGQLDTTHEAVVAIIMQEGQQGGLCSGTIVKVDAARHIGWVATAAHCVEVPPVLVVQGADFTQPDALRYEIIDYKADNRYTGSAGSSYDFAMIRIAGVDASTPTIPLVTSPDGLTNGTPVLSVGYGRTTLNSSGSTDENTVRRRVSKTLNQVGSTQIAYNMSSNGICQGDSGGPVLVSSGGAEKVAGVHSYVQGDCNGTGVSGRVQAGLGFFDGELDKPLPPDDCGLCQAVSSSGNGLCAALTKSCLSDKDCKGYYDCLQNGGSRSSCLAKFPKAEGPFNAAVNCACTRACVSQCQGGIECQSVPKCGYKFPAGDCQKCTETACCDESLACAGDGTCYACLKTGDAAAECATNAARKTLATCVASKCKTECAGTGLDTGADPSVPEGSGGGDPTGAAGKKTTTTTSGCSLAPAGRASSGSPLGLAFAAAALASLARRKRAR